MAASEEYIAWKKSMGERNSRLKAGEKAAQQAFQQWIKSNPGVTNRQPGVAAAFQAWLEANPGENWAAYSAPQGWKQGAPTTMTPNQSYDQFGQLISAGMIQGTPEQQAKVLPPFPTMPAASGSVPPPIGSPSVSNPYSVPTSNVMTGGGGPVPSWYTVQGGPTTLPLATPGNPITQAKLTGTTGSPIGGGLPINPSQVNPYLANPLMASYYGMQSPYFGGNQTQEQPDFMGNQSTFQAPSVGGSVQNKY